MSTRQRELGNEANLIMLNNQPRVVVTDSGYSTLDSLSGQEVLAATQHCQHRSVHEHTHIIHVHARALVMYIRLFILGICARRRKVNVL